MVLVVQRWARQCLCRVRRRARSRRGAPSIRRYVLPRRATARNQLGDAARMAPQSGNSHASAAITQWGSTHVRAVVVVVVVGGGGGVIVIVVGIKNVWN